MDRAQLRNISNLDLAEQSQTRELIHASVKSLFANFFGVENVAYMH